MNCSKCQRLRWKKREKTLLAHISTGQQNKPLDWFQLIDWIQETYHTALLKIFGDEIQRKQHLHLAAHIQRQADRFINWMYGINALQLCCKDFTTTKTTIVQFAGNYRSVGWLLLYVFYLFQICFRGFLIIETLAYSSVPILS